MIYPQIFLFYFRSLIDKHRGKDLSDLPRKKKEDCFEASFCTPLLSHLKLHLPRSNLNVDFPRKCRFYYLKKNLSYIGIGKIGAKRGLMGRGYGIIDGSDKTRSHVITSLKRFDFIYDVVQRSSHR